MDGYKKADDKVPVVAVVGPTASGKTALAAGIGARFGGEVVSADSMQIYEGFPVATAKPSAEEMKLAAHHLIGFLPRGQSFSVADYCIAARSRIADIAARGGLPVLCGGTGMYVSSLLDNIDFGGAGADAGFREQMKKRAADEGAQALLGELFEIDPETAETLHPNNLGRVIRALEIYHASGVTMSEHRAQSRKNPPPYRALALFLDSRDRQRLYDRINHRVDAMLEAGLLEEARIFYENLARENSTAGQAIGLKEFVPYFRGEAGLSQAVESVKRETRRYAKRQLTWFNRMDGAVKLYIDELNAAELFERAAELISNFLKN
ncbi:MAG: tRNA (adenosine(37)-N6)-dimethylallyltransferase MiaA [Oscillospiraceae bacterium]|nr:tRNA (adenosine(37)-N6)-dimethylallyltransferase MiaA [Oscillospiraceae bacterium]